MKQWVARCPLLRLISTARTGARTTDISWLETTFRFTLDWIRAYFWMILGRSNCWNPGQCDPRVGKIRPKNNRWCTRCIWTNYNYTEQALGRGYICLQFAGTKTKQQPTIAVKTFRDSAPFSKSFKTDTPQNFWKCHWLLERPFQGFDWRWIQQLWLEQNTTTEQVDVRKHVFSEPLAQEHNSKVAGGGCSSDLQPLTNLT